MQMENMRVCGTYRQGCIWIKQWKIHAAAVDKDCR